MGLTKKRSKTPSFRLWIWQICNSQPESECSREREREREREESGKREREMSLTSTAGYVARRAAQRERVRILYRRALKDTLNWAVHRHLFYQDVPPSDRSHKKSSIFHLFISILIIELLSLFFFFFNLWILKIFSLSLSQASELRERFEVHKHVVRFLSFSLLFLISESISIFLD